MSCLLPQFKCQPETFSIHFRPHFHSTKHAQLSATIKERDYFRAQCSLSSTSLSLSTSTAVLENPRLPSLEAHSDSLAPGGPWSYLGNAGPPNEVNFGATLAPETLITIDEAVITAAAAEAVALARTAVKVAKDVVLMVNTASSLLPEAENSISSITNTSPSWPQLTKAERVSITGDSVGLESEQQDGLERLEPTHEELTVLEKKLSDGVTVKSTRHTERKARRVRAAGKAAASVVSVSSGTSSKKKRGAAKEVDYSNPLRYLRGTTSTCKVLTANEELELSLGIQESIKYERLQAELAKKCDGQPTFAQLAAAAGVDQKTLRKRLNYGKMCKDRMMKSNIGLVITIAKKYQGAGVDLDDLVQEGCRGLLRGIDKFDASKGFKFSTYVHWWIRQAVRRSLSDQSRTIRLPFHMVDATYKVKEARRLLYSENGRQPADKEVAEAAGLSMKKLSTVLLTPKATISLDQKFGLNMDLKPSDVIADPDAETEEDLMMKEFMKKDLKEALDTLRPREKQVIKWRFGLEDGRTKTLQEIGEMLGLSRERVRQIESSAFKKLKNKKRTKHLQQYLVS